jgi:cellobiose-specific phosphotransferase system component IIA
MQSSKKKISYDDYLNDLLFVHLQDKLLSTMPFDKFVEYAQTTHRFDDKLGYNIDDVERP